MMHGPLNVKFTIYHPTDAGHTVFTSPIGHCLGLSCTTLLTFFQL